MKTHALLNGQIDKIAIGLSALCLVHCVAGIGLIFGMAGSGLALFSPDFHEWGFAIAALLAAGTFGYGYWRFGRTLPLAFGIPGIIAMGVALALPHSEELLATIIGVALLTIGHILNVRNSHF